jgi:hypothetical protein
MRKDYQKPTLISQRLELGVFGEYGDQGHDPHPPHHGGHHHFH